MVREFSLLLFYVVYHQYEKHIAPIPSEHTPPQEILEALRKKAAECETQEKEIQALRKEIRTLKQELALVRSQKYQPKSERHDRSQLEMFADQVSAAAWHEVERKEGRKKARLCGETIPGGRRAAGRNGPHGSPRQPPPRCQTRRVCGERKAGRKPGQLYVKRELYPVFAREDGTKLCEAPLPTDRGLRKCRADESLLTHLVLSKYLYHLPIKRVVKQLRLESGVQISKSTATDWEPRIPSQNVPAGGHQP